MRRIFAVYFCFVLASTALYADSKNPADYPLRLHIFSRTETAYSHHELLEEAKGEGRGNLFENGVAHGVDFNFECAEKLHSSVGYETYYARWKKPGKQLTVILPIIGSSGQYFTCTLNADVKNFAYTFHHGKINSESVDVFKAWMTRTDYDPEHGKNMPASDPKKEDGGDPN